MFNTALEFQFSLVTISSFMGLFVMVISIYILTRQAIGREVQTIAKQTAKLAEKGITENIAGLVGNDQLSSMLYMIFQNQNQALVYFWSFLGSRFWRRRTLSHGTLASHLKSRHLENWNLTCLLRFCSI